MLDGLHILIAEDQPMVALDLGHVVKELGGLVVGPVASVAEAMKCIQEQSVAAAILDANLVDRDDCIRETTGSQSARTRAAAIAPPADPDRGGDRPG